MNLAITIHPSWLQRPDALRRMLSAIAALEVVAPTPREPGDDDETSRPEVPGPAPRREPGDFEEEAPADGRQLLGWSRKQVPDAMGQVMSFGKKRGYPSKIVTWSEDQVLSAWAAVRAAPSPTR